MLQLDGEHWAQKSKSFVEKLQRIAGAAMRSNLRSTLSRGRNGTHHIFSLNTLFHGVAGSADGRLKYVRLVTSTAENNGCSRQYTIETKVAQRRTSISDMGGLREE